MACFDAYFDGLKKLKGLLQCLQAMPSGTNMFSFTKMNDGFINSLLESKPRYEKNVFRRRLNISTSPFHVQKRKKRETMQEKFRWPCSKLDTRLTECILKLKRKVSC